jgi:sugar/nucleoside kinase (ribokinase family)
MTLLIAGWVAIDEIETPFGRIEGSLGGSAPCAALAAALFTDVRLLAAIGEDFPDAERRKLDGRRIDLAGLTVEPGVTSRWGGRYHYDMNTRDTVYTELGVNAAWQPVLPPGWESSEMAFLAAGDPVVQRSIIQGLLKPRLTMVDTIKYYIDTAAEELQTTMGASDLICINESEARELAKMPSIARAARVLLGTGAKGVLVKLGEYGAAYASGEDYFVAPGYPLEEVIDPTGAGDAFAGAVMGYLDSQTVVDRNAMRRAIIYGSTVASFQVEGFGPEPLLSLTRGAVERRYAECIALTHIAEVYP